VPSVPPAPGPLPGPAPMAAPSGFDADAAAEPSVAFAKYNPRTGEYMGTDGKLYQQADLSMTPKSWQDLMPT